MRGVNTREESFAFSWMLGKGRIFHILHRSEFRFQSRAVHCIPHLTNTLIKPPNFPPVVVDLRQMWDELEVDLFMVQIILCELYAHLAASLSAITSFDKYNIVKVAPGKMPFLLYLLSTVNIENGAAHPLPPLCSCVYISYQAKHAPNFQLLASTCLSVRPSLRKFKPHHRLMHHTYTYQVKDHKYINHFFTCLSYSRC